MDIMTKPLPWEASEKESRYNLDVQRQEQAFIKGGNRDFVHEFFTPIHGERFRVLPIGQSGIWDCRAAGMSPI